jgi:hypothetical protein
MRQVLMGGLQNTELTPDEEQIITSCHLRNSNVLVCSINLYIKTVLYIEYEGSKELKSILYI